MTLSFTEAIEGATVPLRMSVAGPVQGVLGHRRQERHAARVPDLRRHRPGRRGARGGGFSLTDPCVDCKGRGLIARGPLRGLQGQRPGQVAPAPCRSASPRASATASGSGCAARARPGERGGPAGDLYVVVHVDAHPVFGRKGDNLTVTVPVTFPEAALGGEIKVPDAGRSAGHPEAAARHAQRAHDARPRQGRGPQGRHPRRPAGHRRGEWSRRT